ncbi:hypothetical protein pb186bvf_004674 [Paramecium bursaria]
MRQWPIFLQFNRFLKIYIENFLTFNKIHLLFYGIVLPQMKQAYHKLGSKLNAYPPQQQPHQSCLYKILFISIAFSNITDAFSYFANSKQARIIQQKSQSKVYYNLIAFSDDQIASSLKSCCQNQ